MEAIFELIFAFIVAIVQSMVAVVVSIVGLLGMILEFVFFAIMEGRSSASKRFKERRQTRRESRARSSKSKANPRDREGDSAETRWTASPTNRKADPADLRRAAIFAGAVLVGAVSIAAVLIVKDQIRRKQIAATRAQIEDLADRFVAQIKDEQAAEPEAGLLADRDAWDQRVELFVDRAPVGPMIVVRSHGPNRESGTLDDLLAVRVAWASAQEVGGALADQGIEAGINWFLQSIAQQEPEEQELPDKPEAAEQ